MRESNFAFRLANSVSLVCGYTVYCEAQFLLHHPSPAFISSAQCGARAACGGGAGVEGEGGPARACAFVGVRRRSAGEGGTLTPTPTPTNINTNQDRARSHAGRHLHSNPPRLHVHAHAPVDIDHRPPVHHTEMVQYSLPWPALLPVAPGFRSASKPYFEATAAMLDTTRAAPTAFLP
ncbi:hypothetical protein K438DRAFT_1968961 [Mycena galopus ATCC 62051]|nr:hypothetical protein K438DRAFT_1968961 [Mycena galopus ATCC 62051]